MTPESHLDCHRFLQTLNVVARETRHLAYSRRRLFAQPIDADWVRGLDDSPEIAERLEAFVSRFGRMQDTMANRLLPRWLICLAEMPGSQIETLNRAERLGVIASALDWLEARQLRNRLVHEYMENPDAFARDLLLAQDYSQILFDGYARIRNYAGQRMEVAENDLPEPVDSGSAGSSP